MQSQKKKREEEAVRVHQKAQHLARKAEKEAREKTEEIEHWWKRAHLRYDNDDDNLEDLNETDTSNVDKNRIVDAYTTRDANDYSQWEDGHWTPADPVTLAENEIQEAILEKKKNQVFENSNTDFCSQFRKDVATRKENQEKKEKESLKYKLLGNRSFTQKEYINALTAYSKALESTPFSSPVLINMAQCHLRLHAYEDAIEYCTRTLFVQPGHVKAHSRLGAAYYATGRLEKAVFELECAMKNTSLENEESVLKEYTKYKNEWEDQQAEASMLLHLNSTSTTNTPFSDALTQLNNLLDVLLSSSEKTDTKKSLYQRMLPLMEHHESQVMVRVRGGLPLLCASLQSCLASETDYLPDLLKVLTICIKNNSRNQTLVLQSVKSNTWLDLVQEDNYHTLVLLVECCENIEWQKAMLETSTFLPVLLQCISKQDETVLYHASTLLFVLSIPSFGATAWTSLPDDPLTILLETLQNPKAPCLVLQNLIGVLSNLSSKLVFRNRMMHCKATQALVRCFFFSKRNFFLKNNCCSAATCW